MTALTTHSALYTFAHPGLRMGGAGQTPSKLDILSEKVNAFFNAAPKHFHRTRDNDRLRLKDSMSISHITSSGFQHRYAGAIGEHTNLLLEMTIDMKDLVFHCVRESKDGDPLFSKYFNDQPILDSRKVTDFQIHLEDRTCTYTEPGGKKVIIDLKRTDLPPSLQEFSALYFEAADPFFHHRYQFDENSSPLNGATKVTPNAEFKKIQAAFINENLKGFEKAQTLFSGYMVTHNQADRVDIMVRFAFCYFMQQQLIEKLVKKVKEKEDQSALITSPKTKKKLAAEMNLLKEIRAELEQTDIFAVAVALGNFPRARGLLDHEDLGQIELTLTDQIKESKKAAEKELRDQFEFANKDDKKKSNEQKGLEERYIRENCLGLFNFTCRTQLLHARAFSIGQMPRHTIENVFVRDALLVDQNYTGEGFKNYFLPAISDPMFKKELGYMFEEVAQNVEQMIGAVPPINTTAVPITENNNTKNPPQAYLDARDNMNQKIDQYLDALEAASG